MTSSEEQTLKIVQDILNIPDLEMRTIAIAERLNEYGAEEVVEILHSLCQKAKEKDEKCKEALLSFVNFSLIIKELGNAKLGQIYKIARDRQYNAVVRLLSRPSGPRNLKKLDREQMSDSLFDEVPLGGRRYLAKQTDEAMITRLLHDPDPMVIRDLLRNPRMTEQKVLRIASKRPNSPETLEEISLCKKWIVRYAVKIALVRNPYTPPALAIKLLHLLMKQDLKEICQDSLLHPQVIEAAKSLMEKDNEERLKEV